MKQDAQFPPVGSTLLAFWYGSSYGGRSERGRYTVTRLTKTQMKVTGVSGKEVTLCQDGTDCYGKPRYKEYGEKYQSSYSYVLLTPELAAELAAEKRHAELLARVKQVDFARLTTAQLESMCAALDAGKAD